MPIQPPTGQAVNELKFGNVSSSIVPQIHLIPSTALIHIANRFQLGVERKGSGAWNATTDQTCLKDNGFLLDRVSHLITHALKVKDAIISGNLPPETIGDAAAVAFGGILLICAIETMIKEKENFDERTTFDDTTATVDKEVTDYDWASYHSSLP